MGRTRIFFLNNYQRNITWKLRKGSTTHRLYILQIPIKLHEDIMNGEIVMECTRVKITQNKHKNTIKGP